MKFASIWGAPLNWDYVSPISHWIIIPVNARIELFQRLCSIEHLESNLTQ